MKINEMNVSLSIEDRNYLKNFFELNKDYIDNNDFSKYENIRGLANRYEKYINKHDLRCHDILMLFLAELRFEELSCKITSEKEITDLKKDSTNKVIQKWYMESNAAYYVGSIPIDTFQTNKKLEHNKYIRTRSLDSISGRIFK